MDEEEQIKQHKLVRKTKVKISSRNNERKEERTVKKKLKGD